MDLSVSMSPADLAKTKSVVDSLNKALNPSGSAGPTGSLGKNDFLKLLMEQLTHQDPSAPMNDQSFIAQMAQFSTLEQMTNMNESFNQLKQLLAAGQALNLLGKKVEIAEGENIVQGTVDAISGQDVPQLLVGGNYYDYSQISKVLE